MPHSHEVSVWRVALDCASDEVSALREVLSSDERARAERFHFARDRGRYIVGRARLRMLLGEALGRAPAELEFRYGPAGKPEVTGASIPFNVSHSDGLALIAIGGPGRLGVDVERVRPRMATESLTGFFAPGEEAAIRALPRADREAAFYACWTRKEAWIKALGDGIGFGLERFEVSVAPGDAARLLWVADDAEAPRRWELRDLNAGPGFAAALAVEGEGFGVKGEVRWATSSSI